MTAYYNEIDPYAAQWLRNLIAAGHIAPGDVDDRSIEDVRPDDLRGYEQCHFFAGIGVWSHALRRAGVADSARVWTGSCPCQPFSSAGKGDGFADERHLWPAWLHLIAQCEPAIVIGEQVASKAVGPWIDLVCADMETLGYAFGAVPFPSAGVGAPHIRDRAYWVAHAVQSGRTQGWTGAGDRQAAAPGSLGRVADTDHAGLEGRRGVLECAVECVAGARGVAGWLADSKSERHDGSGAVGTEADPCGRWDSTARYGDSVAAATACPVNGLWRDADWLLCRDGKWRSVEPGTFPLASGAPARVGRLCAYGNAINAEAARIFIEACGVTS